MIQDLRNTETITGVQNEHFLDQVLSFVANRSWEFVLSSLDEDMKVFHIGSFEWDSTLEHSI